AAFRVFLCLAWLVTPRLTRAMATLLQESRNRDCSAVRQEVLLDVIAVCLEQRRCPAEVADLLGRAADHHVPLALLSMHHLAGAGDLEALLGAALGLHLGHFGSSNWGDTRKAATACPSGRAALGTGGVITTPPGWGKENQRLRGRRLRSISPGGAYRRG